MTTRAARPVGRARQLLPACWIVAQKIASTLRALDATRFDLKYGMPGLTHEQLMTNVELYGRRVIPRVRELLA